MKKTFLTAGIAIAAGLTTLVPNAHAYYTISGSCSTTTSCQGSRCPELGVGATAICNGYDTVYIENFAFTHCDACKSGYKLTSATRPIAGTQCQITFGTCEQDCTGCSNCNTTSWANLRTGYQSRTYATCNCNTCTRTTEYRCAAGYYGTSTNGTSGCSRCPSSGGVYGSSAAGSTVITACYLPSGTTGSDSTGTFTYTNNCYYSN